tara:strand:+ start:2436 stop:2645 length:210 start_codon:yes stop_codon:yes gene_type:complete
MSDQSKEGFSKKTIQAAEDYWTSIKTNLEQDIVELAEDFDIEDCKDQMLMDVEELSKVEKIINVLNTKK